MVLKLPKKSAKKISNCAHFFLIYRLRLPIKADTDRIQVLGTENITTIYTAFTKQVRDWDMLDT